MGDVMDRAQERGQEWLHDQLAHQAARRQALPGVRRCVGCQTALEREQKR
ncbi:hypothetical protein EBQ26_10455 [Allofranklinella schreckenbergeri]|uniref:Zinc finger DksA/TraR C4-type domain-containing protein n=1 Tax=Allofranklinella schreckenbergeri TaxID=1076744 RepID=A0A3M6Q0L6_9BURK|nr:TraR/DksA C4-type zinc finger protein [Allofranklinella schreckenbergeri]RMW96020.1 hypothetical protein EBQ26_10455 [Allofranklinella schreckenbergeri]